MNILSMDLLSGAREEVKAEDDAAAKAEAEANPSKTDGKVVNGSAAVPTFNGNGSDGPTDEDIDEHGHES